MRLLEKRSHAIKTEIDRFAKKAKPLLMCGEIAFFAGVLFLCLSLAIGTQISSSNSAFTEGLDIPAAVADAYENYATASDRALVRESANKQVSEANATFRFLMFITAIGAALRKRWKFFILAVCALALPSSAVGVSYGFTDRFIAMLFHFVFVVCALLAFVRKERKLLLASTVLIFIPIPWLMSDSFPTTQAPASSNETVSYQTHVALSAYVDAQIAYIESDPVGVAYHIQKIDDETRTQYPLKRLHSLEEYATSNEALGATATKRQLERASKRQLYSTLSFLIALFFFILGLTTQRMSSLINQRQERMLSLIEKPLSWPHEFEAHTIERLQGRKDALFAASEKLIIFASILAAITIVFWSPNAASNVGFYDIAVPFEIKDQLAQMGASVTVIEKREFLGVQWAHAKMLFSVLKLGLVGGIVILFLKRRYRPGLALVAVAMFAMEIPAKVERGYGYYSISATAENEERISDLRTSALLKPDLMPSIDNYLRAQFAYHNDDVEAAARALNGIDAQYMVRRVGSDWRLHVIRDWLRHNRIAVSESAYHPSINRTDWRFVLTRSAKSGFFMAIALFVSALLLGQTLRWRLARLDQLVSSNRDLKVSRRIVALR